MNFSFFLFLQDLFREWLAEKEESLNEVQTRNFKDSSEMNSNVRQLAVSEELCSNRNESDCRLNFIFYFSRY